MFRILFVFFIIVPIIEISVIMQVGALIGTWPTVAIVILTAWFGAKKVREQGLATLTSVQSKMAMGEMPSNEIISGVMLLISGVLLVTPGFVTDAFGLALLFPKIRTMIAASVKQHLVVGQTSSASFNVYKGSSTQHSSQQDFFQQEPPQQEHLQQGNVIEGEFEHKKEEK